MNVTSSSSNVAWFNVVRPDEDDPSLGVREPRRSRPSSGSSGAAAPLHFEPEPEAEGIAQGARVNAAFYGEAVSPTIGTAAQVEPEVQMFPGDVATFDVSAPRWRFWRRWQPQTLTVRCLDDGTLLIGGIAKLCASTGTKEPGTPTRATATTEGCSSSCPPGTAWAAWYVPTLPRRANSFIARGVSTDATGTVGVSGAPRGRVV